MFFVSSVSGGYNTLLKRAVGGLTTLVAAIAITASTATAQVPVATYLFNDTLAAQQGGIPALTLLNPVAGSTTGFITSNVTYNGVSNPNRRVLHLDGNASGGQNAGLQLSTVGVLASNASYSFESVFLFSDKNGAYRKILDVTNRASDAGFYVNPSNILGVFSDVNPSTGSAFTPDTYFHVVLTQSGGNVTGYLNGVQAFTGASTTMAIDANNVLSFFLDDNSTGNGEYSDSSVALIRLYDGALTSSQVSTLAASSLPGISGTSAPEPTAVALLGMGLISMAGTVSVRRRRKA